ncbi:hypothetical protein ES708_24939 [subsurface metagenome]
MIMAESELYIKRNVEAFVARTDDPYDNWYVGSTDDLDKSLYSEHGVDKMLGIFLQFEANDGATASRVVKHFIEKGAEGETGKIDKSANIFYIYKITNRTNP